MQRIASFALAFATVLAPLGSAQTIGGHVLDRATRGYVEGVRVRVLGPRDTVLFETVTDSMGVFYVALSHAGTVRLRFAIGDAAEFRSDSVVVHEDEFVQRDFVVDVPRVFTDVQVEKPVSVVPRQAGPRYPADLKAQRVAGEVVAQFVVDTSGRALMETFRILRSTHPSFSRAVMDAVEKMQFYPAEIAGRKVKQLARQPFTFSITSPTGRPGAPDEEHAAAAEPRGRDRSKP